MARVAGTQFAAEESLALRERRMTPGELPEGAL